MNEIEIVIVTLDDVAIAMMISTWMAMTTMVCANDHDDLSMKRKIVDMMRDENDWRTMRGESILMIDSMTAFDCCHSHADAYLVVASECVGDMANVD